MPNIDPSKSTPQAPRKLRVGSKGWARARAAEADGKGPPEKQDDDDDDDDGDGADDAAAKQAAHDETADSAAACYRAAADAAEATKGTDSASAHMAGEAAHDDAMEAGAKFKASCVAMRGGALAEAPAPESKPDAAPAPSMAQALAVSSTIKTADAHIVTARLAEFGAYALARLGLTVNDVVKAKGVLGGKIDLAARASKAIASEARTKAKTDEIRRVQLWEQAVRDRRVQMAQAFTQEDTTIDGKPAERRVFAKWAKAQNAAYPEIDAFEAWISSRVPEPGAKSEEPSTVLADAAHKKHIASASALTERDRLEAKRAGVDPDVLAAQVAMMTRGQGGADERV
jgi:hypothetical protein